MKRMAGGRHLMDRPWRDHINGGNNLLTSTRACCTSLTGNNSRVSPLSNAMLRCIPMASNYGSYHRNHTSWTCFYRDVVILSLVIFSMVTLSSCSIESDFVNDQPPDVTPGGPAGEERSSSNRWTFSETKFDKLKSSIREMMKKDCRDIPGLSLSLVSNGKQTFTTGLGYADLERGKAVTRSTVFCVASLSKAFTSTLLARLIERKGLSWDTKVWDILRDEYPFRDDYMTKHVTIRDLLLHRTGIARHDMLWISGIKTQEEIYRRFRCIRNKKGFRGAAIYNNIMYALAGHVAEKIGAAPWEELLTRELLEPLGMTGTTFRRNASSERHINRAKQYVHVQGRNVPIDDPFYDGALAINPAIGVYSNAFDMATWMQFQLSLGKNSRGHSLISQDMMREMHKGQVSTSDMLKPSVVKDGKSLLSYDQYGLGWFVGYYKGYRTLMHYGSYPGFYSMITLVPSMNFSMFTSLNGGVMNSPFSINAIIHSYAMDLAMAHGTNLPSPSMDHQCSFPQTHFNQDPFICSNKYNLPLRHLKKYTGTYSNAAFGNLTFSLEDAEDGEDEGGKNFIMTYNSLRFIAIVKDTQDVSTFCATPIDPKDKYVVLPQEIVFNINIVTDIIDRVSVPCFLEEHWFVKVPEGVRFDDWYKGVCGGTDLTCNKIEPLPSVAKADVPKTGFCLIIFSLFLLCL